jgi:hypothetical protein
MIKQESISLRGIITLYIRSEPAKSTIFILLDVNTVCSVFIPSHSSRIVNTAWERLDMLFMDVDDVNLLLFPMKNSCSASSSVSTSYTFKFLSTNPFTLSNSCTGAQSSRAVLTRF